MGIIGLRKCSFLEFLPALIFFHVVVPEATKHIIFGYNPSCMSTYLSSGCTCSNMYPQCQPVPFMKYILHGVLTVGNCTNRTSDNNFNVTQFEDGYVIFYEDVDRIKLWFILNTHTLLPSQNCCLQSISFSLENFGNNASCCKPVTRAHSCPGSLPSIKDRLKNFCNNTSSCNPVNCPEKSSKYIIYIKNNESTACWSCPTPNPITPPTNTSPTPQTSTTVKINITKDVTKIHASDAVEIMDNLSSIVKTMGNANIASVTVGEANLSLQGVLVKQIGNANVNIVYSQNGWKVVDPNDTSQLTELWSVSIPDEAFHMANLKQNGTPFVGVFQFPTFSTDDNSDLKDLVLNNKIYGISMGANIINLTQTIDIYFRHVITNETDMTCMSCDGKEPWTTDGCDTHIFNKTIKCSCTHLTFFAILMSPSANLSSEDVTSLTYITSIGCGLSTFFLIVALFIHFLMGHSKSRLGTTILIHLFVAVGLLNITFFSNQQIKSQNNKIGCIIIAATLHFSMLATFTWFFIQSLHFYLSLKAVNTNFRKFKLLFIALGWGFPAGVVILIAALGNYGPMTNVDMCWITNLYVHYIVNVGYYTLIFIFTSIVFTMIIQKIIKARLTKPNMVNTSSKKAGAIICLLFLSGLTWGVAFFNYGPMATAAYYIFTIFNSFQGFFMFLYYYCFRNDEVNLREPLSSTASSTKKTTGVSSTASQ